MEQNIASGNRQKTHACRFAAEKSAEGFAGMAIGYYLCANNMPIL